MRAERLAPAALRERLRSEGDVAPIDVRPHATPSVNAASTMRTTVKLREGMKA